jgi:hypothetical protein
MQEFMIFIHTQVDHMESLNPQEQQSHMQRIGAYIGELMESGKFKGAQPLERSGALIESDGSSFKDAPFVESKELIVGYFHIEASSLDEAISIAKKNPVLTETNCTVSVRPIKKMEGIN